MTPEIINIIVVILSILVYSAVFIIQKAQFTKQNEILGKYEKIFSIFNIDEIEKYVEVQKKSINLELNNREVAVKINEKDIEDRKLEVDRILQLSKTNLEGTDSLVKTHESYNDIMKNYILVSNDLITKEFDELYLSIQECLSKNKHPELFKVVEKEMNKVKDIHKKNRDKFFLDSMRSVLELIKDNK